MNDMPRKAKPTPKLLERAVEGTEENDARLAEYKAGLKLLDPEDRRKRIQAMIAAQPRVQAATLAELFGVSESTIYQDMMALRDEARQRFAGDPDVRADLFKTFEDIRDASLSDAVLVPADNPARSAHRRNALSAHKDLIDVMFRCGWVAEVPKRHELTGAGGGALQVETKSSLALLADPEACALATQLISRLSGGEEQIDGPEAPHEGSED